MKSGKIKRESHWLSHGNMAASLGISVSAFRQWGVPPVARIGREVFYSPGDVTENRLRHDAAMREKKAGSASGQNLLLRQEKLRLMRAQCEGQQLKNAELREQLIPVDVLQWTLNRVGASIAQHLAKIPAALRKKCPKLNAASHKIIKHEIEKCQQIAVQAGVNLDFDEYDRNQT